MPKDKRYKKLKLGFTEGRINSFAEFFEELPKTTLIGDLGIHHETFKKFITDPEKFTYKITIHIASLIGVDDWEIIKLIYKEIEAKRGRRKK
jgi:hypothetical protein